MPVRASSAKTTGGNWLPVAEAAKTALDDMRDLYANVLNMRQACYDQSERDNGVWISPKASEWDMVLDEIQRVAEGLRKGLKGR